MLMVNHFQEVLESHDLNKRVTWSAMSQTTGRALKVSATIQVAGKLSYPLRTFLPIDLTDLGILLSFLLLFSRSFATHSGIFIILGYEVAIGARVI